MNNHQLVSSIVSELASHKETENTPVCAVPVLVKIIEQYARPSVEVVKAVEDVQEAPATEDEPVVDAAALRSSAISKMRVLSEKIGAAEFKTLALKLYGKAESLTNTPDSELPRVLSALDDMLGAA